MPNDVWGLIAAAELQPVFAAIPDGAASQSTSVMAAGWMPELTDVLMPAQLRMGLLLKSGASSLFDLHYGAAHHQ